MTSAAGLAAFAIGFNLLSDRLDRPLAAPPNERTLLAKWKRAGAVAICIGFSCAVVVAASLGPSALEGRYKQSETGSLILNYVLLLSTTSTVAGTAMSTLSTTRLHGKLQLVNGTLLLVYLQVFAFLVQGDRNLALSVFAIIAVAYSESVKPISLRKLVVFVLAASFLFAVVGVGRRSPRRTIPSFLDTVFEERESIQWDSTIRELSYSAAALYAATAYVPEKHDFFRGRLMFQEALGIIPFSRRVFVTRRLLEGGPRQEQTSSLLLTWVIVGSFGSGGKGTTSVADIYVNFGLPGVVLGLLLVGLACKATQQRARAAGSIIWLSLYCILVPQAAYMARATILGLLITQVLWPTVVIALFSVFLGLARPGRERTKQQAPLLATYLVP